MKDDAGASRPARPRRTARGNSAHLYARNAEAGDVSPGSHVPLQADAAELGALAERFARNPSELARFFVELHARGVPVHGLRGELRRG